MTPNTCTEEQVLSQEMIKESPNFLIVRPGRGLGQFGGIWRYFSTFYYVQVQNKPPKRRLDGSLAKFLLKNY